MLDDVLTRCQRILGTEHPDTRRAPRTTRWRSAQNERRGKTKKTLQCTFHEGHRTPWSSEKNCLLYEQGRIDLVWRDWQLLGDAKAKQLDRCVGKRLGSAFSFRGSHRAQKYCSDSSMKGDAWRRVWLH